MESLEKAHPMGDVLDISENDLEKHPGLTAKVTDVQIGDNRSMLSDSMLGEDDKQAFASDGTLLPARGTVPHGAVLFDVQQSHERHPLLFGRNDLCSGRDLPQRVATDRVVCRDEEITTRYPDTNSPLPHCLRQG